MAVGVRPNAELRPGSPKHDRKPRIVFQDALAEYIQQQEIILDMYKLEDLATAQALQVHRASGFKVALSQNYGTLNPKPQNQIPSSYNKLPTCESRTARAPVLRALKMRADFSASWMCSIFLFSGFFPGQDVPFGQRSLGCCRSKLLKSPLFSFFR